MKKCKNAKTYKGIHKPRCNGGKGCDACWAMYRKNCKHPAQALTVKESSYVMAGPPLKYLFCTDCNIALDIAPNQPFIFEKIVEMQMMITNLQDEIGSLDRRIDGICEQVRWV